MAHSYVALATGAHMPSIGLGTWQEKNQNSDDVIRAVETAVECGYRHIDTAFSYAVEKDVGKALQKLFTSGKVKREELFIVTKLNGSYHKRAAVQDCLKQSLEDLQLEYVDLYLVHAPMSHQRFEGDTFPLRDGKLVFDEVMNCVAQAVDHLETWQGMEDIFKAGKAKAIGLSNFNSHQIERIYQHAEVKPHNLQVECHAYWPQNELFDFCKQRNIVFTAYAPIGSPGYPGFVAQIASATGMSAPKPEDYPILLEEPTVTSLAKKYGKTPAQILLRWLVQRDIVVIPKSANVRRIQENFNIFDFSLSREDFDALSSLPTRKRFFTFEFGTTHPDYPFNVAY